MGHRQGCRLRQARRSQRGTRIAKESAFDPADSMAEMVGLDIPCPWCAGGAPKPVC